MPKKSKMRKPSLTLMNAGKGHWRGAPNTEEMIKETIPCVERTE